MKEEAAVNLMTRVILAPPGSAEFYREVLPEITRELERSLDYCVQENIAAKNWCSAEVPASLQA